MNINIEILADKANLQPYYDAQAAAIEKFAQSMVFDLLNDITNDDSLGSARVATVERLAKKWGVSKK
jgi:hypothetical protein